MSFKLGVLSSHPIQYQAPLFRELAQRCDLQIYFTHRQTPQAQAAAGFGVPFEWDVDLLAGYAHTFLTNVARRPATGVFMGCDTPAIGCEIKTRGFDAFLVMGWHLKCYWQAIHACHQHAVPVMVRGDSQLATPRSHIKQAVKALLYPWVIRQFDACLHVGQRNLEYLQYYGAPSPRLFFAPHCVDTEAFAAAAARVDRDAVRVAWGLSPDEKAVLFVGKFIGCKRPTDLVHAIGQMRKNGQRVVLVWAGDGPERQALSALGAALGVPMQFLGFCNQSHLPEVYRAADVLALPSESETWGLVVNEALACGTPCVVSDACGCAPDMIIPEVTGTVFKAGNVDSLSKMLCNALRIARDTPAIAGQSDRYSVRAAASGVLTAVAALQSRDVK
ncbi:MAG: glycosyltransferase family 4 protein [Aeromicrobium sp.]|nr:glycosyltransferase family 4 protein [Burkholderiales bacterium]